jgi:putative transposase
MPNHFHAIIMIGENRFNTQFEMKNNVTRTNKFGPQSKNSGSIMRGFKSAVTTTSKILNIEFGWQARFHDHIIRNHNELISISNYIKTNPQNWKGDKFFN